MENKLLGFQTQLHKMEARLQEIEKRNQEQKQSMKEEEVDENSNLRDKIKELEDKTINDLALNSVEHKLDIKLIKEEMNKLIKLDHEHNKRALNLIIFGIKEQQEEDMLEIVKEELNNNSQIDTTYLIETKRLGKIIDHKDRLIRSKL